MIDYKRKCARAAETSFPSDKSPYRHFFCRECNISVNICVCCDRGQIYCPNCQDLCKKKRIKNARNKYVQSPLGRERKREQNKKSYKLKKKQEKKDFQGDRGSPSLPSSISNIPPALPMVEGVKNEIDIFNGNSEETKSRISKNKKVQVFCAFCCKECAPYRRPSLPWRQVRELWIRRSIYSKGGFTP